MPVGVIDPIFDNSLSLLKAAGTNVEESVSTGSGTVREWADLAGSNFSRDPAGANYANALTHAEGTLGDTMSAKLQSDYLACQARAAALRESSSVRCAVHAAGRRSGHGHSLGVFGRIAELASDYLVAGSIGYAEPEDKETP